MYILGLYLSEFLFPEQSLGWSAEENEENQSQDAGIIVIWR